MAVESHEPIVALGRDPISAASPVGDPVRYEPVFEQLQGQMDRVGSLTGQEVEWRVVVELATEILKSKSKDLLVMTYLAIGLFEHRGYVGLATGLEAYREFLRNFWERCFPKVKPPHGRYNAVQYLADKVLREVEFRDGRCRKPPKAAEKEAVHRCAALAEELDQAVEAAFSALPEAPNLRSMSRALRTLKEKVGPLGDAAPPAAAPAPAGAAPVPAGVAAVPEAFATATQAVQTIVKVAKYLLSQDNKDPRGYRLMRAVHFGGLAEVPKDRVVPPPPATRRQALENTAAGGNWPALLSEAEGQFAATPLWLDMQRYVATALNGMGPAYAAARGAVAFEAVALHARLPDLFERSFKDGTPFADGATKAWLEQVRGEFGGGASRAQTTDGDALAKAIAEARKLLSEAKAPEAVARLAAQIDAAPSQRQRFQGQLALAAFCLDMNKLALATSLLEGLESLMDRYQLDEWEPELAARAVRALYECLRKARPKPTPDDLRRSTKVFARLCRLDPAAALQLEPAAAK